MRRKTPSRYLHGTAPEEQKRLSLLNDLLNEASLHELRLRGGEKILDLGCGLAQLARGMGSAAGTRVIGVERSGEQIVEARRQALEAGEDELIELRQGEAHAPPLRPEEWGTFDLAHARFLVEHVPDPASVVGAMVRAVRPGGRIVLEDDDHDLLRCWPEPPGVRLLWQAYIRVFEGNGNDPYVGRKLPALLHGAGASPVSNTWHFFGGCSGMEVFPIAVENMIGLCQGVRDPILATGLLTPAQFEETVAGFRDWSLRPDAALWFALAWADGVR